MPRPARSKAEVALDAALKELYPHEPVKREVPIKVRGRTLFIDRVLEGPGIAIEIDGRQHDEFVEHFHRDAQGFKDSQQRDALKESWLKQTGYVLVRFSHSDTITKTTLRTKILKAFNEQR